MLQIEFREGAQHTQRSDWAQAPTFSASVVLQCENSYTPSRRQQCRGDGRFDPCRSRSPCAGRSHEPDL